ncbi:MAG: FecR domain-containing protein [Gammaproteobacteria bacterium]
MSGKVLPFGRSRQVPEETYRQACAWLMELQAGLSPGARERLDKWLVEDARHPEALLDVATLWDDLNVLSDLSKLLPLEELALRRKSTGHGRRFPGWAPAASIALALLIVVLGGVMWVTLRPGAGVETLLASAEQRYQTEVGKQLSVTLPDGSQALLNTNTALVVRYSAEERSIWLERGEAYFSVAKNASRPFRVRAGNRLIEAVGTAFTVRRKLSEGIEVTVGEGEVKLRGIETDVSPDGKADSADVPGAQASAPHTRDATLSLGALQYASFNAQDSLIETKKLSPEQLDARLAWRHGMLLFQGETLEHVLQEVNRYSSIRIEADPAISQTPVIGVFRVDNIDRLLAAMRENFQIDARRIDDDHILLTARR